MRIINYGTTTNGLSSYLNVNSAKKTLSGALLTEIASMLPERSRLPNVHPEYMKDNNLIITERSTIDFTFIDEGAGYRNAFGYIIYDINAPPKSKDDIGDIIVVFPNASKSGAGGAMKTGDTIRLASKYNVNSKLEATPTDYVFQPGQCILLCLLQDGWKGSYVSVNAPKFYSQKALNQDKQFHTVILPTSDNSLVVGFEDLNRGPGSSSDDDFNDLILMITATPETAISTLSYVARAPQTNEPPTKYTIGYKKIIAETRQPGLYVPDRIAEAVATLYIPEDAEIYDSPTWLKGKMRTNKAYVASIIGSHKTMDKYNYHVGSAYGKSFTDAHSLLYPDYKYKAGDWIYSEVDKINPIGQGIHYFRTYAEAENYKFK